VWVVEPGAGGEERKIAAIGIRVSRGVSYHGVSLNVAPDLSHYGGIVPCGISDHRVTSLADLGKDASIKDVDMCLRRSFERIFGPVIDADAAFEASFSSPAAVPE
jgi:lipoyl(octanoyl) transferase